MPSIQSRRAALPGLTQRSYSRNCFRNALIISAIVAVSVAGPSYFLATKGDGGFVKWQTHSAYESSNEFLEEESVRRIALEQIGELFPQEVRDLLNAKHEQPGHLNLNVAGRNDLSSSWIREGALDVSRRNPEVRGVENRKLEEDSKDASCGGSDGNKVECRRGSNKRYEGVESEQKHREKVEIETSNSKPPHSVSQDEEYDHKDGGLSNSEIESSEGDLTGGASIQQVTTIQNDTPAKIARKERRGKRFENRLTELIHQDEEQSKKLEAEAIRRAKEVEGGMVRPHSVWRPEEVSANSDNIVRVMRDQLIMARAYANIASIHNDIRLVQDLKSHIKENVKLLEDVNVDSELPDGAEKKMKALGELLSRAKTVKADEKALIKKLRAMLQASEDQLRSLKKQSNFLSQLAAKTVPKGLHCLSMRLTVEYNDLSFDERQFKNRENLEDRRLYHYALFSDNVLATAVVVNSTITNSKEPRKHVIHVVTDTLNYGAMRMWFLNNPPDKATIEVLNVDDFKWLNSSYCPILKQQEMESTKAYFYKSEKERISANLKYRNPKYLSMLNHLRFYLPEVFPKLDKILFLDDDIVVKKDLTPLWSVNLEGKVNGAVETCGKSFHRFDKYLNFSNPHIARNFDPNACGWAYGMNIFDLKEWKKRGITAIYHRWQTLNGNRTLWKLGTLPPGLTTFYRLTHPIDKSWHVLGLGYNPNTETSAIEGAAVVHYNGNLKPWLEIGISKFKHYWAEYVKYDHPWLQQCNISK
ncbi:hypothetical protein M758_2G035000 [Ceratodon purpureus]|uniref:Hexosyltransferase n=1 Tax=Ceratodon purpureus TaxID=3225 RepID=A0A8T0IRR3_CERPU|nr:hypothetical protein KC19_2G036100 [Ceratodon purpureus]KAG0625193.1 hypothetical protein M758_2G035000 [Ceratodon purpureus]